jgi:mitochondrial fusion and transport protein UGO1
VGQKDARSTWNFLCDENQPSHNTTIHYTMSTSILKRPREEARGGFKPKKRQRKVKKQLEYHSSSEDDNEAAVDTDFKAVNLQDSEESGGENPTRLQKIASTAADGNTSETEDDAAPSADSDETDASSENEGDSDADTTASAVKKRKRNDPDAFATSMSKILSSKLSTQKRSDPVLSRSKTAQEASKSLSESRLETKARHKLREEKRLLLDKGRIRDVLGFQSTDISTEQIMEQEKRLKKTAQRGVVKLFNAVRAAQIRGEEEMRRARREGVVGMTKREERVSEMSKKGFLELIAGGGKK